MHLKVKLPFVCSPVSLWECLNSRTVKPALQLPATSNPACGFLALGFPLWALRCLWDPILLVGLFGSGRRTRYALNRPSSPQEAIAHLTVASRSPAVFGPASDVATNLLFYPVFDKAKNTGSHAPPQSNTTHPLQRIGLITSTHPSPLAGLRNRRNTSLSFTNNAGSPASAALG